jgi:hypothetical protein
MIDLLIEWLTGVFYDSFKFFGETEALAIAKDRQRVFSEFLKWEEGFNADKLAILDKGIKNSPFITQVENYPERLTQKPGLAIAGAPSYPAVGELPFIDEQGLEFLHLDIKQACVCIGGTNEGPFKARWLGRNALDKEEFWSTTKILPILNIVCSINEDISACAVRGDGKSFRFLDLAEDIVTYEEKIASSNALSAMMKRFQTYAGLETWLKGITGNQNATFRGLYGEAPLIAAPELVEQDRVLLTAAPETEKGDNSITTYDLTRIISMVGWHYHLPVSAQLPGMKWNNLKLIVPALGKDTARYIDVALETLGIRDSISNLIILSKLGFGYTKLRKRTEITYTCFVQFRYKGRLKSVAMALRGAKALGDLNREAVEIDARMAAEVTEILRRLVTGELK